MNGAPSAAEFADVVTEVLGQGEGRVTAGLQRGEVGGVLPNSAALRAGLTTEGPWMPMNQNSGINEPDEGRGRRRNRQRRTAGSTSVEMTLANGTQAGAADNVDDGDKQDGEAEGERCRGSSGRWRRGLLWAA